MLSSRSGASCRPTTKNTLCLPGGIHEGADRRDVTRPLGLDAVGECVEAFLLQRCAGEAADLLAKAGTQAIDVEAGHLRRR